MPNELFGSVGFALSADRRRPKTLARRLTIKERKRQAASISCEHSVPKLRGFAAFRGSRFVIQFHQSTCDSPGKLTERHRPSQKRMRDRARD